MEKLSRNADKEENGYGNRGNVYHWGVDKKIRVGMTEDPETETGPAITRSQMNKVPSYIEIGREERARLACGGK